MKLWQKCPICNGAGTVSGGFYGRAADYNQWLSDHAIEQCRQCKGTGLIETPDATEYQKELEK